MRLFIKDKGEKKYLDVVATSRKSLQRYVGGSQFTINGQDYSVNDIAAEKIGDYTSLASIIGGVVGIFAGPAGIIAGVIIGGALGSNIDRKERLSVEVFNNSKCNDEV